MTTLLSILAMMPLVIYLLSLSFEWHRTRGESVEILILLVLFTALFAGGLITLTSPCSHLGAEWQLRSENGNVCRNLNNGETRGL
jgi:hypothetical protein